MRNERIKQILDNCDKARQVEKEIQADKAYLESMAELAKVQADLARQKSEQTYQGHHTTAIRTSLSTVL